MTRALISARAHHRVREFAEAVSDSPDALITIAPDLEITSHNEAASRLYGRPQEDAVGRKLDEMLSADPALPERLVFLHRVLSGESVPAYEQHRLTADGRWVHVEISGTPITDDGGNVVGMYTAARDITETVLARRRIAEQQRLLEASQAAAHLGSWELDLDRMTFEFSGEQYKLLGLDPTASELTFEAVLNALHADDRSAIKAALLGRGSFTAECRVVLPSGEVRTLWNRGVYEPDDANSSGRMIGISNDVTDERAERAAREQAERELSQSFEVALIGMLITDLDGRVLRINRAMCAMLGRPQEELLGTIFEQLSDPADRDSDREAWRLMATGDITFDRTRRYHHPDGYTMWVELFVTLVTDADGNPRHHVVQAQDVTQRHEYEERLRYMADHDSLTGLLNRRGFDDGLRAYLRCRDPDSRCGALLIIDLDHFKHHNDTHGHLAGDKMLTEIAGAIALAQPEHGLVARLGGDEFAVLLEHGDEADAQATADVLSREIMAAAARLGADPAKPVTASIGMAFFDPSEDDPAEGLIYRADSAMYRAKARGRNCYAVYAN